MPQWFSGHRWFGVLAVALATLVVFVACGGDGEEKKAGPLKIGYLLDFTGALASFGPEEENAIKLAVKHINDGGGVLGQPVQLVRADSGTDKDIGVAEATRLVDIEKVHAIVGSLASGVTLAVAEGVTGPKKILQISHASTSPALTAANDNDFLFRTPISDAAQGVVLAKLVEDLGYTSVCTMYVNNAYGQGLSSNFATAYEDAGGTVTAQISHADQTAATTYLSELNQCTAGDPQALVAISYPVGQAQVYLKEALENDLIDTFVFVDGTKDDEMFGTLGWDNFDGLSGTAPGALPPSEFTAVFDDLYEAEYGSLFKVPFTREAYDAAIVIALAAEKAGSVDPTAIRDALRDVANAPGTEVGSPPEGIAAALKAARDGDDINYTGASGSVEFDENGDVLIGAIEVWSIDAAAEGFVTEKNYKVDLAAGTVEEITGGGAMRIDPVLNYQRPAAVLRIDPTLERALRLRA
ncbi:MAG: ABC transporter substrate-binding protein [Chloroflexi bacterium]|nr:ABC transporter substrate-binding protein [Chloroflexota bacterium]